MEVFELWVVDEYGDDFVVWLAFVEHGHDADGSGFADAEGGDRLGAEYEDIEGVVVFGVGLGDEAVGGGVVDGAGEYAVEAEHACCFIELVFVGRTFRDLDDRAEVLGEVEVLDTGSYIVPWVDHGGW